MYSNIFKASLESGLRIHEIMNRGFPIHWLKALRDNVTSIYEIMIRDVNGKRFEASVESG